MISVVPTEDMIVPERNILRENNLILIIDNVIVTSLNS